MKILSEIRPVDVVLVAQRLAGSTDPDVIRVQTHAAMELLKDAAEFIDCEAKARESDAVENTPRDWLDELLFGRAKALGYEGTPKDLREAFRKGLSEWFPEHYRKLWMKDGRLSVAISLAEFEQLWPWLSKWRRRGAEKVRESKRAELAKLLWGISRHSLAEK